MKKVVSIVTSVLLVMLSLAGCGTNNNSHTYSFNKEKTNESVIQSNGEFAFNIFKELNKEDRGENIIISPLSISTALSMTYQGAMGTTKDGMAKALRYKGIDMEVLNEGYKNLLTYLGQVDNKIELNINNSIWIREGEKLNADFLKVNKDVFNADIKELDFTKKSSVDQINNWIDDSTKGKIEKIIEPPIAPDVMMYLINAIYFKGEWTEQFNKKNTFDSEFYPEEGKIEYIKMMSRKDKIKYGLGNDFAVVRLPYGSEKTSMYFILPKEELSVNKFVESMDLNKWQNIKESISEKSNVLVQIPRFKTEYGVKSLNESLVNLGMKEAFKDSADFTGISENIFISSVLHKAVIEVNEEGSEAAAATVAVVTTTAMIEPTTFIVNRPFMFIITDDESGTILFMGKQHNIN